ncbi:MAG: ParA family protein [Hyphomicrobiaceae bacterium]|nr:ParA family protein [Hyphomicrobiaceae bacterium]
MASIVIMNAKGGVGKSTLTMALAETLAYYQKKSILLVDADGQMSLSLMMAPGNQLSEQRGNDLTLVGYMARSVLDNEHSDWPQYVMSHVSDVEDAKGIYLLPGELDLPLLEREMAAQGKISKTRAAARTILQEAEQYVDHILVDCAPGISVMTETWLRECDYHIVPVKPDFLAVSGLEYLRRFRSRNPEMGLAEHLGVIINMVNLHSTDDAIIQEHMRSDKDLKCFKNTIPIAPHLQKAALFSSEERMYITKYAGDVGTALRAVTNELQSLLNRNRKPDRVQSTLPPTNQLVT